MTNSSGRIRADAKVTTDLAGLQIEPRDARDSHRLAGLLRQALDHQVKRRHSGVLIAARFSDLLLDEVHGVDLVWTPEARAFAENRARLRPRLRSLHSQLLQIRASSRSEAGRAIADHTDLAQLDDHQVVNVAAMTMADGPGLCVFDEQGAGKTVTLIFAFDALCSRDEVDRALIVAPKSMVAEWKRDFTRFMGDLYTVRIVAGTRREKLAALRSGADVLVTNFETAAALEHDLRAILRRYQGRFVLGIDESFYVKNLDARRTQAIRRLREFVGRAYVLCGTPAPNAPHDLVQQFNVVDFGIAFDGVEIPDDREHARPVVQGVIEDRGLYVRHLKQDVLPGLPEKSFTRVVVPLEPEQERLYRAAEGELLGELQGIDDTQFTRNLTSYLARRAALLQLCCQPASVVSGYWETPAKLMALDSLLEELVSRRSEKVVIWSFYTASIDAIMLRYQRFHPVRYDGSVSSIDERREAVRRFQEDDETMLFVGNPAAAGAGLTLHRARFAIYESMSNQAAHYLQSLDRIHRRGQERAVEYLVLLADETLELSEYDRLNRKERAAQELLGDQVAPPATRQAMLDELTAAAALRT